MPLSAFSIANGELVNNKWEEQTCRVQSEVASGQQEGLLGHSHLSLFLTAAAHLWMFNGSNCPIDSSRWLPPPLLHTAAICSAAAVDVIVLALMIIVVPSNWFLTDDLSTISTNTLSHFHFLSVIMIIAPSKIATHCGAAAVAAAGSQLFFVFSWLVGVLVWGASETAYERKAIYLSSINWLINLYGAAGNVAQHEHTKTVSVCTPLQTLCCGWSFSLQTSLVFLCFLRHMDTVADVAAAAVGLAINRQIAAIRRENWQIRPFANRSPLSTHNYASASEWVCNRIYIGLQSTASVCLSDLTVCSFFVCLHPFIRQSVICARLLLSLPASVFGNTRLLQASELSECVWRSFAVV